jgi:hypothetical protein
VNLTPYVASLRVYEPLESFDPASQARWNAFLSNAESTKRESENAIKNLIFFERIKFSEEGVHTIDRDGKRYVSPWSVKNRTLVAMHNFKESIPSSIFHFFIPAELENFVYSETTLDTKIPYIITERWMIPPRWFALFRSNERLISRQGNELVCVFRTEITKAKVRCMETHKIVRNAFGDGSVEAEIGELLNWLNVFDENSLVELDYGGLALFVEKTLELQGGEGLEGDTSVEDVQKSILGLSKGDGVLAGQAYGRFVSRWREIASIEQHQ